MPSFKINTFAAPANGPSFLGQWIAEVLCADEPVPDGLHAGAGQAYAGQMARVAQLLLQLSGVPVFDPPGTTCQAAEAGNLFVELRLPELGLIAQDTYVRVLGVAADLCRTLARTPVSDAAKEQVFAEIDRLVIVPAQATLVFGKSTMQVLRSAHKLGIPFLHLGAGVYQFGWGSKARRMERSMVDRDSAIARQLVRSKAVAAGVMRMAGLPAPVHLLVSTTAALPEAAAQLGFPLVVKPADSGRGEGVSVDITDLQTLSIAFEAASEASPSGQVIVERQVAGVCHRLFIANGRLLYAVKRLPLSLKGDGRQNIAALVEQASRREAQLPPWRRSPIPVLDDLAWQAMQRAGWQPDAVPEAGVLVPLRRIESTAWGGVDEDVSVRVHPDNLAAALCAAKAMSLENAGVDFISTDIAVPWYDNGAVINEVNIGPLLGGGEISRSYLPSFFRGFIEGDGKIPLETFTGEGAEDKARRRQADYAQRGLRCFATAAAYTLDPDGNSVIMRFTRLEDRTRALLCHADVDALLVIA